MKKGYCLFVFMLLMYSAFTQPYILTKEEKQVIDKFEVLPNRDYSFEKIISDSSLPFTSNPLLYNFKENGDYWVRFSIENTTRNAQELYLSVFPFIDDAFYYFDSTANKWQIARSGLAVPEKMRSYGFFPITIDNNSNTRYYAHINLNRLANDTDSTHARLRLYKTAVIKAYEQQSYIFWIATLVIILILFLYNLYTWFVFKDKAFLYYLVILVGGMIYITALDRHFNTLIPFRYFQVMLSKEGYTFYYDICSFLREIGILLVVTGFLQFTRSFLQTKAILPVWDKVLKYFNLAFAVLIIVNSTATITGIWFNETYPTLAINISVVTFMLLIILVGIISYKRKYTFGKYFLLANILPILLVLLVAVIFIINPNGVDGGTIMPNIAILSLVVTFAVALSARINVLKQDLGNEQLQAQSLINNLKMAEQSNTEKEIVLKEIHHRVKNNLQIINGLLFMQFKDNNDEKMKAQLKQSQERIKSMALVHNKLYQSDSTVHVYIKEYIKDLAGDILKANTPAGKSIQLNIQENAAVNLSLDTSVSLGLILNELITNSCKYAFTNKESGHINIAINKRGSGYQLIVKDDGTGLSNDFHQKNSMGLRLVNNLSKQLGGKAQFENNNGTVVIVDFVDGIAA
jgi:two-component sensor histidine kinase